MQYQLDKLTVGAAEVGLEVTGDVVGADVIISSTVGASEVGSEVTGADVITSGIIEGAIVVGNCSAPIVGLAVEGFGVGELSMQTSSYGHSTPIPISFSQQDSMFSYSTCPSFSPSLVHFSVPSQ